MQYSEVQCSRVMTTNIERLNCRIKWATSIVCACSCIFNESKKSLSKTKFVKKKLLHYYWFFYFDYFEQFFSIDPFWTTLTKFDPFWPILACYSSGQLYSYIFTPFLGIECLVHCWEFQHIQIFVQSYTSIFRYFFGHIYSIC